MAHTHQVIITPRAEESLEKILNYLIENVSFETAKHVRQKLLKAIYSLNKMPTANPVVQGIISGKNILYRRVLSMSYRIVFTINESVKQVIVVEIHHVKQDAKAIDLTFE